jgi:uncharacterized protein (TIGR02147 family)
MAILTMGDLAAQEGTPSAIRKRLRKKLPVTEIQAALERLQSLGLLEIEPGAVLRPTQDRITTRDDVANRGAREYHKSVMSLAAEALEEQPVDIREFQSVALAVPKGRIGLAKEMIRKFRSQFETQIGSNSGDEMYQLNVQFFQLTESPPDSSGEDEGVDPGFTPSKTDESEGVKHDH